MAAVVSLKHVIKRYRRGRQVIEVLHNLDLEVEAGEFLVVDGPAQIPVPGKDGYWIHPVNGKLHVHTGEQICETVLLR